MTSEIKRAGKCSKFVKSTLDRLHQNESNKKILLISLLAQINREKRLIFIFIIAIDFFLLFLYILIGKISRVTRVRMTTEKIV